MVIVGVIVVVFSVSNQSVITLDFWPLPYFLPVPFFSTILVAGFLGFIGGALVAWMSSGKARRNAKHAKRRVSGLEKDLNLLKEKIGK